MSVSLAKFPSVSQVPYRQLRAKIESGDLLLCSGSAVFSKLIQKVTRSVWSHVGFVIRLDSIDRVMVLESVESVGVRTIPLSHYARNYDAKGNKYPGRLLIARDKRFKNVEPARLNKMSQFAVDLFGYPYDKDEILRIAKRIGQSFLGFSAAEVKRDREYICSEYAWECYNAMGITYAYDPKGFIAPKDFARDKNVQAVAEIK